MWLNVWGQGRKWAVKHTSPPPPAAVFTPVVFAFLPCTSQSNGSQIINGFPIICSTLEAWDGISQKHCSLLLRARPHLQLSAPFDLAKGIWPAALRWDGRGAGCYSDTRRTERFKAEAKTPHLGVSSWRVASLYPPTPTPTPCPQLISVIYFLFIMDWSPLCHASINHFIPH